MCLINVRPNIQEHELINIQLLGRGAEDGVRAHGRVAIHPLRAGLRGSQMHKIVIASCSLQCALSKVQISQGLGPFVQI